MSTSSINRLTAALAGRYTVEREIGAGGMAAVYLARDIRHSRPVAVKVMSADLQQSPERFLAEIRTAANLHHPHILPLYDSGEADGFLYFTMPFIEEGVTLETRLEAGALSVEESVRIAREIGDGLAHAHKQGLVHRDVKPANILFSSGHALLADFGIARAVEKGAAPGLTKTGHYVGSPQYMSPEQAFGNAEVDARSDLYSLACVLYEMLTGELPYQGGSALNVITAHAFNEVPLVAAKVPTVPDSVNYAVARAMAKQPEERFASMEEFLTALTADVDLSLLPKPRKGKRVARVAPWGMGAAAVITVAGAAYMALTRPESTSAQPVLVEDRVVIAPLRNETGDPAWDQVGRMASDLITEGLQRTRVQVVPSATALQAGAFAGAASDPIVAIAEETGAGKVVTGSYYLFDDSLEFMMQVTDAVNSRVLGQSDRVKASRSNPGEAIEKLRDYVMTALALHLDPRLADVDLAQMQPPSYESYRAFDEGMQRYLASDWRPAADAFRKAYTLDPTFVLALNYLTFSESNMRPNGGPVVDSLTQMLMARRSELPDYHKHWLDYLAARIRGNNEEARTAIRQAADLAPGSKAVYNFAYTASLTNRPKEAVEALRTLDPERGAMRGWFPYWAMLTDNLHRLGEHEDELQEALRAAELHPSWGYAFLIVAQARAALGHLPELRALVAGLNTREMRDITPGEAWIGIADELRAHGHETEAAEYYQSALAWLDALPEAMKQERRSRETRATALTSLRRFQEARDLIAAIQQADPQDLSLVGWVGTLDAWLGNRPAAMRALERMKHEAMTAPYSRGLYALQAARIAAVLDDPEQATEYVLRSVASGYRPLRHPDMNFDKVLDHPPFHAARQPKG
jgi:serine/threonine protein kinase